MLKDLSARNQESVAKKQIVLISGDRHISEIQSLEGLTNIYEITSSPIHSSLVAKETLAEIPNKNRKWALAGENNFGILNTDTMNINFYTLKSKTKSIKNFKLAVTQDS